MKLKLNEFLNVYDNRIFKHDVVYKLERKNDYGIGYSNFNEIDPFYHEFLIVERFEIANVCYENCFADNSKNKIELDIYIKVGNKDMMKYFDESIFTSPAYKILKKVVKKDDFK
jgi:hypothetical protein